MVQPNGLKAMKGVYSLGWEGVWKRVGGNQDSCRRMPMVYVYAFGAECLCMYIYVLGWGAFVSRFIGSEIICID
jgi:hypothetical protein